MKLLLFHHASALGGGSLSLLDIVVMLQGECDVVVCAPEHPAWLRDQVESLGVDYLAAPLPMPLYYHYHGTASEPVRSYLMGRGVLEYFRYRKAWIQAIRASGADMVVMNSAALVLFGPIARAAGCTPVCFVRETFPSSKKSLRTGVLYRLLGRHCARVIFLSEHDRRASGIPADQSAVVLDCVRPGSLRRLERTEACATLGVPSTSFNVLFTGGESWLKGLDTALQAMQKPRDNVTRMLIAGTSGNHSSEGKRVALRHWLADPRNACFKRRTARLLQNPDVAERVVFLGPQTDMSVAYSAADVVIFPSSLPHQARPVYESGVYQLPIVISDFPNTAEFVRHGGNGLTFTPRKAARLADALDALRKDRELSQRLGMENGRRLDELRAFSVMKRKVIELLASEHAGGR